MRIRLIHKRQGTGCKICGDALQRVGVEQVERFNRRQVGKCTGIEFSLSKIRILRGRILRNWMAAYIADDAGHILEEWCSNAAASWRCLPSRKDAAGSAGGCTGQKRNRGAAAGPYCMLKPRFRRLQFQQMASAACCTLNSVGELQRVAQRIAELAPCSG